MNTCPSCTQQYDERSNDSERCMACEANAVLIEGGARSLADLPMHKVIEDGVNGIGQRFVRLEYADVSVDVIDPMPWDEKVKEVDGRQARRLR